jgi:hypothetical protein
MELKFRDLRADEIDCRVATVKEGKGISLLLYKDARCDMIILDETVGPMRWQREHSRDNANCRVGIFDPDLGWVWKEDTGTESNTEAEKGLASDSFKRACFNWGIGRELYTAPFIWVDASKGSKTDRYSVAEITIENKKITALAILNEKTHEIVYTFGKVKGSKPAKATKPKAAEVPVAAPAEPAQPVAAQPAVNEPALICQRCHGAITDVKLKNGGVALAAEVKAFGIKKFPDWEDGLCAKCQGELMKSRQGGNQ